MRHPILLRSGETLRSLARSEVAILESGHMSLDVTTLGGFSLSLRKIVPGEVLIPLDAIGSSAIVLSYRAEQTSRIGSARRRKSETPGLLDVDRMATQAREALLATCIRVIHEIACLQAPHRLYCELLRLATQGDAGTLSAFALPTHAALALRICATRETISRELSFLRREGVVTEGKIVKLTNVGFLLSRLANALNLSDEREVWLSIAH